jgi:endonuclease-8
MPEGDTIYRVAKRLRPALQGQPLVRIEAPRARGRPPSVGTTIERVEPVGKHLLIGFAGGIILRTHLRMSGSWHLYRAGERWRRPPHLMRALVEVPDWVAICFSAPVVEFERAAALDHLGPDLCQPDPDLDLCLQRMAELIDPRAGVAEVLLDHRIACGVGNVFKSEACFAVGIDPRMPIGAVPPGTRRALLATASRQLQANREGGPRQTVAGTPGSVAVYRRAGQACRRCGTAIQVARTGQHGRSTYWCPTCQPPLS